MKNKDQKVKCACGCVVKRSELVRVKWDGHEHTLFLCCPNHPTIQAGHIKYRVYKCVECGKECYADPHATMKDRCDKHRDAHIISRKRKNARESARKRRAVKRIKHENIYNCNSFHLCGFCIKEGGFSCRMMP
jgi:hypothetical protein